MRVFAVRRYSAYPGLSTYPLCPRCDLLMEREYQRYCDHGGQALSRKGFSRAIVILAWTTSNGARRKRAPFDAYMSYSFNYLSKKS